MQFIFRTLITLFTSVQINQPETINPLFLSFGVEADPIVSLDTDSEELNENGEETNSSISSSGCSAQEIIEIQKSLEEACFEDEEVDLNSYGGYQNTKEENLLCSFAVQNSLSRSTMEHLIQILQDNFLPENIKVNYRKMKGVWSAKRPIKKFSVIIPTVQKTKLGKKKKKKNGEHSFVAYNPAVHDLSQKVDVKLFIFETFFD
jgi:hypothetical protein